MSEIVREAQRRYEAGQWLAELQAYGKERAAASGLTEEDIDRVIHEARLERRKSVVKPRASRRRTT